MKPEKKNIEEIMKNLSLPVIDVNQHQKEFRLTLLNTKKSAFLWVLLLILPFLFLSGVILKHYLKIDFGFLTSVYDWIGLIDHKYGDSSILNWIIRILLLFGPLVAVGVNLLSILHVRYEKKSREIFISVKVKWLNWLIISICAIIFLVFFSYLIFENIN